jgi:hypothetical protein
MGLRISIMRDDYDSSANVFHGRKHLTLVNVPGPSEPTDDAPAAVITSRAGNKVITPEVGPVDCAGPMFGGTFGHSSDSRFSKAAGIYGALPIHDRYESWANYERMSR